MKTIPLLPSVPMRERTPATIEALVARGHSVTSLECALGLSAGYLSKVRHHAVRPSPQLAALLEVALVHPETLATIRGVTAVALRASQRGCVTDGDGAARQAPVHPRDLARAIVLTPGVDGREPGAVRVDADPDPEGRP